MNIWRISQLQRRRINFIPSKNSLKSNTHPLLFSTFKGELIKKNFGIFGSFLSQNRILNRGFKNQNEREEEQLENFKRWTNQDARKDTEMAMEKLNNPFEELFSQAPEGFSESEETRNQKREILDSKTIKKKPDTYWREKLHAEEFV